MTKNFEPAEAHDSGSAPYGHEREISRLLQLIFRHNKTGFIEYRNTKTDKRTLLHRGYLPLPFDLAELHTEIGENLFSDSLFGIGLAPRWRKSAKRGTDADVNEIGCLWAEFSYDQIPGGVLGAIERISGLRLRPSLVVETGTGKLACYVFSAPLRASSCSNGRI